MFEAAICKRVKYHDWRVTATRDGYQIERCVACGEKMAHKLDPEGRPVRGREYYEAHIRDFAHPDDFYSSRIFYELYGHKRINQDRKFLKDQASREEKIEALSREFKHFTRNA